jgi:crotonobetainyl-CoA:carnitine CoA-transferase CaiB-like acyl-CoA transferase
MSASDVTSHSYLGGTFNRLLNPTTIGRMPNFYLPCKDGYVTIPAPMDVHWERLVEAMGNPAWALTPEFSTSPARSANWIELRMRLIDWTMTLSGAELYGLANQTQLPIFQFYPVRKLVGSDQVRARDSVVDIEIGNRRAKMPGAPFAMRASPWTLRRPAPRLGEHNAAILGERAEVLS